MRSTSLRRAGAVLAALALTTVSAAACGEQEDLGGSSAPAPSVAESTEFEAGTTMAELSEAGVLRLGTKFDQPLFGQKGLGDEVEGFDVEIARIIAGALGIPATGIEFTEAPSAQREELLVQDRVDIVVATYTINDKRRERVSFAGPYYQAGQTLMVASDNTTITGPDTLRSTNARVCSVQGSTPAERILEYVDPAQLTLFDVYSKCADALRTGQVDAVTTDNVILLGFVDGSDGAFKLAGEPFSEEPYGIGIAKGDVEFCEFINETLAEAEESGAYEQAWTATAGTVDPEVPTLPEPQPCS